MKMTNIKKKLKKIDIALSEQCSSWLQTSSDAHFVRLFVHPAIRSPEKLQSGLVGNISTHTGNGKGTKMTA